MTDTTQAPAGLIHSRRPGGSGKARGGLSPAHRCGADASGGARPKKAVLLSRARWTRAGGQFRFALRTETGAEDVVSGHYIEVSPPHKLAFSWSSEKPQDAVVDTRVTVDLLDLKDGTTRVVMRTRTCLAGGQQHLQRRLADMLQDMSLHFVACGQRSGPARTHTTVSSEQAGDRVRPRVPSDTCPVRPARRRFSGGARACASQCHSSAGSI